MLLGLILSALIGTRQIYLVNHHPDWRADNTTWSSKYGYQFVAVYLPETPDSVYTILVDREECQCITRAYWANMYRREEPYRDWVVLPIRPERGDDTMISIYVMDVGQRVGLREVQEGDTRRVDTVVTKEWLSKLPQIEYVDAPFYVPSRRRAVGGR